MNNEVGMSKQAYFDMMEQLGQEPIQSEIPPDLTDFPYEAEAAFHVFNKLSDNYLVLNTPKGSHVRYTGKKYDTFKDMCEIFGVEPEERRLVLDFVNIIDAHAIKKANRKKPQ